jgi:hypothetical protein
MATIVLDTLEYATRLKAGGFSELQAETSARVLAEVLEQQAANNENALRRDIEIAKLELKRDIAEAKAELTRWVIGAGLLQTTVIIGVLMKVAKLI